MQIKRNNRYAIHYPAGAGGDFLAVCIYMLDPKTPNENWTNHSKIDGYGKVWLSDIYQIEVEGFFNENTELYPKRIGLRNSDIRVEDYISLNSILNNITYDTDMYIEEYNSVYKHINSENKHVEIGNSHVLYTSPVEPIVIDMFLEWCNRFNFDRQFYIHFDNLDESMDAYSKFIIKDRIHSHNLKDMDNLATVSVFKYLRDNLKIQDYLKEKGIITIPYKLLKEANYIKIAKYLSGYMDVTMSEHYIDFVETYKKKNALKDEVVQFTKTNLKNLGKTYIDNFEKIKKGMQNNGNSKRKST